VGLVVASFFHKAAKLGILAHLHFQYPHSFHLDMERYSLTRLLFFALTNPGIETGGFFGESKSNILKHIPADYKPITELIQSPISEDELKKQFHASGLQFPVIAKPEVGERGWLISRVNTMDELLNYIHQHPIDTLLQTYVDLPMEVSIMVYAMPGGEKAEVTSICEKYFLQIRGDGTSTIGQLMLKQDRAVLHLEKLINRFGDRWDEVLAKDEHLVLENVGNHCRGTTFLNRNGQIDGDITDIMVSLLHTMPGVYYGRFDMRVGSWQDLRAGKNIRVLEFNGTSSDPAHIYQPGYSIFRAYRDMAFHWNIMRKIARQNKARGHTPARFKKIISALILYFRYKRTN
jgi:hypothetical protein